MEKNKRHALIYKLLRPAVMAFNAAAFGYSCRKATDLPDHYIVVSNHVTDFDFLFVAASFARQMYFVGSEHIARWGWLSKVIRYGFEPIMRCKGASAASAVMEMARKLRRGENVCLFAEGVRTWDGAPCPILPSTARVIQAAGCGMVTYRISGGYFTSPMWCGAKIRRGRMYGEPVRVFTAEQLKAMKPAEIYAAICEDLGEDAYERQKEKPVAYRGKNLAHGLENLMFCCPVCHARDSFRSEGDTVRCTQCNHEIRYDEYGMLHGGKHRTLKEYADWQKAQVAADVAAGAVYRAEKAALARIVNHETQPLCTAPLSLSPEGISCAELRASMEEITDLAMHGQRTVVFSVGADYYEFRLGEGENALKFFLYYLEYRKAHRKE